MTATPYFAGDQPSTASEHAAYPTVGRAALVLGLLICAFVLGFLDKQILTLTVGDVSRSFGIGDYEIGILQGVGFSLPSVLLALPLGLLVDRVNRRNMLILSIAVWSVATIGCGLSKQYLTLLVWRSVVGGAEAALPALLFSLMGDMFVPRLRARAAIILFTASSLSSSASMVVGGSLLSRLSTVRHVPGAFEVWRQAYIVLGLLGLALGLLLLFIAEPSRKERTNRTGSASLLPYLQKHWRPMTLFLLGSGIVSAISIAFTAWFPVLIARRFAMEPAVAGIAYGVAAIPAVLAASISTLLLLRRLGGAAAEPRAVVFGLAISLCAFVFIAVTGSRAVYVASGGLQLFGFILMAGLLPKMYQDLAPNQLRGQLVGLGTVVQLSMQSIAPTTIGAISGHLGSDAASLQSALLWVSAPAWVFALLCFVLLARSYGATVQSWRGPPPANAATAESGE